MANEETAAEPSAQECSDAESRRLQMQRERIEGRTRGYCEAPGPVPIGASQATLHCERVKGHEGAHASGPTDWSAAPPLGPVPERFRHNGVPGTEGLPGAGYYSQPLSPARRFMADLLESAEPYSSPHPGTIDWARLIAAAGERYQTSREVSAGIFEQRSQAKKPLGVSVDPGSTAEVLLAGLVACGRALGRIEQEVAQRQRWKKVLDAATRMFSAGPDIMPPDHEWAKAGQLVFANVQAFVQEPQSEPTEPIRERAEALAILILQGRRLGTPPNFLIRAGAALEVLRAAWRKAQRGGT